MTISTAITGHARRFTSSRHLASPLPIVRRLSKNQGVIIARDDRHEPAFDAGDQLVVDTSCKAPDHGSFYVVEYPLYTGTGAAISVPTLQQCRRWIMTQELYLLGASSPHHRGREEADGLYDRAHFERIVMGRVVGILEAGRPVADCRRLV